MISKPSAKNSVNLFSLEGIGLYPRIHPTTALIGICNVCALKQEYTCTGAERVPTLHTSSSCVGWGQGHFSKDRINSFFTVWTRNN